MVKYHHTSTCKGYISSKIFGEIDKYNGKFGIGFTVKRHNSKSNKYCLVDYIEDDIKVSLIDLYMNTEYGIIVSKPLIIYDFSGKILVNDFNFYKRSTYDSCEVYCFIEKLTKIL